VLPARLSRLPHVEIAGVDLDILRASSARARLLGLAGLNALPPGHALLLPRTRSIHTIGMRFMLDLIWLDDDGRVVRIDRAVKPWRARTCRRARQVIELPSHLV
jgi:uncharacterized protein